MTAGAHFWQDNTLEPFSSQGPTIDGRVKPDISGPDGVANDVFGSFFGTSTSAPHAAGAAALLLGANPLLDPAQLQSILQSKAIDAGAAGDDNQFGWGRLNLGTAPPPPPASPTGDLFFGLAPTRTYDTRAGSAFLPVSNGDQPMGPTSPPRCRWSDKEACRSARPRWSST